jgi:predicted NACHT family NTPase
MSARLHAIYQKIHFLERDIELHKQILATIPSANRDELEETIGKIAQMKRQLTELKESIAAVDPDEYRRLQKLEEETALFKKLAAEKTLQEVYTLDQCRVCALRLSDGSELDCLVAARRQDGDWLVLSLAGECREFAAAEVAGLRSQADAEGRPE